MKVSYLILISFFSVVLFACYSIENSNGSSEQKIKDLQVELPNSKPILEITEDAEGMWDVTGKTLFFNLYDNRVVEFEFAGDKKKIPGETSKAEEINSLKRIKISEDELEKFTDLLNAEDFSKTKNDYKRECCCTDATLSYKINFMGDGKQKNITLNAYCSLDELKNPTIHKISGFPKALSDLMILVDHIRRKYIFR